MRAALAIAVAVLALWGLTRLMEARLTYFPVREVTADPAAFGLRFADGAENADGVKFCSACGNKVA